MSRITRAIDALIGRPANPGPAAEPSVNVKQSITFVDSEGQDVRPVQTVKRDRVIGNTIAPPGARQQWELHRAREESRNLYLTSPIWQSFIYFSRIQVRGWQPARLDFDRMTREQKARLKDVVRFIRKEWLRYQMIPGVGGTGRSIHQMAGSALYHMAVDGDCFLTARQDMRGMRIWDLYPGDALAEQYTERFQTSPNSRTSSLMLGVEVDDHLRPLAYHFGTSGSLARLNFGYHSFGTAGYEVLRLPAGQVQHIRDMSSEVTAVRGWPRCVAVIEDISRLDEWYAALVRSAITRASIALALEKSEFLGDPGALLGNDQSGASAFGHLARAQNVGTDNGVDQDREVDQDVKRYQEFQTAAGSIMELLPGYKPHQISTGSPTTQEAVTMAMLEQRVCSALRVTPATLLGDYKAMSFSNVQGAHVHEREAIQDQQNNLKSQFYRPVYFDFINRRLINLVSRFPEIEIGDFDALRFPAIILRSYLVIDKQRLIGPLLKVFSQGLMTWSELREELGYLGSDPESVIEEWKENRRMLGLPETPGPLMPDKGNPKNTDDDDSGDKDKDGE